MLKKSKDLINDVTKRISEFQSGKIKPLSTGIDHLDSKLLGGMRPSDVITIAALPFHGKTFLVERISDYMEKTYDDVIFLKCLWEIELFKAILRHLSKGSNQTVLEVITQMPNSELKKLYSSLLEQYRKDNIYLQDEPVNPSEFERDLAELIKLHPDKKIVVTIDNLENVLLDGQNQKVVMDDIIRIINVKKKQHPYITFIILTQLNRDLMLRADDPKRHFPMEGDIYGSGSIFKISDVVLILNMPFRMQIHDRYGVFPKNRYLYIDDSFKVSTMGKTMSFDPKGKLFYHYIKYRNVAETYDIDDIYIEQIFDVPVDTTDYSKQNSDELDF